METHVKVLGALQIAFGVIGLLFAILLVFVFGGAAGIVGASGDPEAARIAVPIIGLTGMALVGFLVLTSVPGVLIGIGLLNHRPWSRIAGIVLSIVGLVMVPFGTIIGVYGLWVLFSKDTERMFMPPVPQP